MSTKRHPVRGGFSMMELVIAVAMAVIVIVGIGVVLADGQKGWHRMYNRVYGDVATDGYIARKTFDAEIRKASRERLTLDSAGAWVEVYYYSSDSATSPDRYARFYTASGDLILEKGTLDPRSTSGTHTVCSNVTSCFFTAAGRSAQMILTLDDGSRSATVTASAVMHNQ
jgi:hypothetical protein